VTWPRCCSQPCVAPDVKQSIRQLALPPHRRAVTRQAPVALPKLAHGHVLHVRRVAPGHITHQPTLAHAEPRSATKALLLSLPPSPGAMGTGTGMCKLHPGPAPRRRHRVVATS
jgi:hypothetical protein